MTSSCPRRIYFQKLFPYFLKFGNIKWSKYILIVNFFYFWGLLINYKQLNKEIIKRGIHRGKARTIKYMKLWMVRHCLCNRCKWLFFRTESKFYEIIVLWQSSHVNVNVLCYTWQNTFYNIQIKFNHVVNKKNKCHWSAFFSIIKSHDFFSTFVFMAKVW